MNVLAFIRQRSFARYVAFDLADAARRMGWQVTWVDLDGERQRLASLPEPARPAAAAAVRAQCAAVHPDLVLSYGLEAFAPALADVVSGEDWTVAEVTGAVAVAAGHTYAARLQQAAPALRQLVVDGRAWRHFQGCLAGDPAKAARFLDAARAAGHVRDDRPWRAALADVTRAAGTR